MVEGTSRHVPGLRTGQMPCWASLLPELRVHRLRLCKDGGIGDRSGTTGAVHQPTAQFPNALASISMHTSIAGAVAVLPLCAGKRLCQMPALLLHSEGRALITAAPIHSFK